MVKKPLLIAACLGTFVYGFFSVFWGMINPALKAQFPESVATILLANSIGLVLGSLLSGPTIDRLGNKMALGVGVLLVAAGAFGLGRAEAVPFAFIMALLVGTGGSAMVTSANALVADIANTDASRAVWSNIINNFFAIAAFFGPWVLNYLADTRQMPLSGIGSILAGVCVLVAIYYFAIRFPAPRNAGTSLTADAGQVMGRGLFWALTAMLCLYIGCEGTVWYWMNTYLTGTAGLDKAAAGSAISLFAMGIIVGRIVSSVLLGRKILSPLACTLLFGVGIAITYTAVLFATEVNTIRVLLTLAGVSMAPMFPTILAAVANGFPKHAGTAIGLAITGGWLGMVFIPPTIGYVADLRTGMFITSVAAAVLIVANIIALAASKSAKSNGATA